MRTIASKRTSLRLALVASLGAASLLAPASPLVRPVLAQAPAPIVGVVDGEKINNNFPKLKEALAAIESRKQALRSQLDGRVFIAQADTGRFDALVVKPTVSDAERGELDALAKKGNARRAEYSALIAKATKTDADTARIKSIEDESKKTAGNLQKVIEQVDQAVVKQEQETEDRFRAQIVKAVEDVANQKKLLVVVGKQAVAWSAGSVEITDEVIARLNKA